MKVNNIAIYDRKFTKDDWINESKNMYPLRNDYVVCKDKNKELNDFLKISVGCIIDYRHDGQGRQRYLVVYDNIPEELLKYFYHSFSGYFHYFYKSNILKCSGDRKKFQDIGYDNIFGLEREKFLLRKEEEKRKKIEMMKNVDPYNEETWDDVYEMRRSRFTPDDHVIKQINTHEVIRDLPYDFKDGREMWVKFTNYLKRKLIGKVCSFPVLGKDKDGKSEIHGAGHWRISEIYLDDKSYVHIVGNSWAKSNSKNDYDVILHIGKSDTDYIYYEDTPDPILPWDPYNEENWDDTNEEFQEPAPKLKVGDRVRYVYLKSKHGTGESEKLDGLEGVIVDSHPISLNVFAVEFDENIHIIYSIGHNCDGMAKDGHGYWIDGCFLIPAEEKIKVKRRIRWYDHGKLVNESLKLDYVKNMPVGTRLRYITANNNLATYMGKINNVYYWIKFDEQFSIHLSSLDGRDPEEKSWKFSEKNMLVCFNIVDVPPIVPHKPRIRWYNHGKLEESMITSFHDFRNL